MCNMMDFNLSGFVWMADQDCRAMQENTIRTGNSDLSYEKKVPSRIVLQEE